MGIREININIRANVGNVPQAMNSVASATNQATNSVKQIGPAMQQTTSSFGKLQGAAMSGNKAINQFADGSELAQSKLGKFGKIFSDNRGIVFGVAGLTSALGEAVGMMGMYGDTALRLKEAQAELNDLEAQGVTAGKAHADAVAEVVKQQRFFNMVQRNTILSQMDMIFFSTMVISGLVKMSSEGGMASGVLGKLGGVFKMLKGSTTAGSSAIANFMTNFSPLPNVVKSTEGAVIKTGSAMGQMASNAGMLGGVMGSTVGRIIAFSGALAAIGLAAYGLTVVIQRAEEMKQKLNEVIASSIMKITQLEFLFLNIKATVGLASDAEKKALEQVNLVVNAQIQALAELHMSIAEAMDPKNAQVFLDKLMEILNKTNEGTNVINKSAQKVTDIIEAFNIAQTENKQNIAAATPYVLKLAAAWDHMGLTLEQMKEKIKPTLDSLTGVAQPIKDMIEKLLNQTLDSLIAKEKELEKENTIVKDTFDQLGVSANEAIGQFVNHFGTGSQIVKSFFTEAQKGVDAFNQKFGKEGIEVLQSYGAEQTTLHDFLMKFYGGDMTLVNAAEAKYADQKKLSTAAVKVQEKAEKQLNQAREASIQKLRESKIELIGHTTAITQNEAMNKRVANVMSDTTQRVVDQAMNLKANKKYWDGVTTAEINSTENAMKSIRTWAMTNDRLSENVEWNFKVADAITQAMVQAKEWSNETALAGKSSTAYRNTLIAQNAEVLAGVPVQHMLTSEIQSYIEEAGNAADASVLFERKLETLHDAHMQFFDSLTSADNGKDFNKAFKDMDFGAIPKKLKDDVKDFFEGIRDAKEKGQEAAVGLNAVGLALSGIGDGLSKKDLSKILKKSLDSFVKFAKAADPEANNLAHIPGFIDSLKGNMDKYELTIRSLAMAQSDLNIDQDEFNGLVTQFVKDSGGWNKLTQQQKDALAALGVTYDSNTGKITNTKDATDKYTQSMQKLNAEAVVVQTIADMWILLQETMVEINDLMVEDWTDNLNEQIRLAADTVGDISKVWSGLVGPMNKTNVQIANKWEVAMKNILHNAIAASSQTQSVFSALPKKLNSHFVKIANNFQKAMENIAHNAKAAASQANASLASIKDRTVTITYKKVGSPQSQGGVYSFAEGGLISAASGKMNISNGPTRSGNFLYGDNSGGREIQAFIPLDGHKADHIMDVIDAQVGRRRGANVIVGGSGTQDITVPIVINIGDQTFSFTRKYRVEQGRDLASQVF